MPIVVFLILISIIILDAIHEYLIILATILSIILPPPVPVPVSVPVPVPVPVPPVHTRSSMPEPDPDPGCSPPLNLPPYQTLPNPESTLQTVPKKIPILTDLVTSHTTNVPHGTIRPIAAVPENRNPLGLYSLDQPQQCSATTESDDCTSVGVISHIGTGTAENLGLSRIEYDSGSETYFDADTGTPGKLVFDRLDADSNAEIYFDMDTGTNADSQIPLDVVELMSDLQGADLDTRKAAASTLKCISLTPDTVQLIATSCLRPLVDLIFSGDDAAISLAARILRDISLQLPEKHRQLMADARVIPAMVEILSFCSIPRCQQYAVQTLRNLTKGTRISDAMRRLVVVEGGFKRLIRSLSGPGSYEVEAEALCYIAPATPVSLLLSQGIIPLMVHVLRHESSAARQVIAATIPSLPRSNRLQAAFGKSGAIHLLTNMLDEDLTASHEAAARALCCLLRCNKNLDIVRKDPACIAGLVRMLRSDTVRTCLVPAIACLLYLVPIWRCREEMLAQGVIKALKDLKIQVPGAWKLIQRLEGGTWMEKVLCLA
ncbi:uncharacterized protein LOC144571571 isoform X2 [Carex rostrata]